MAWTTPRTWVAGEIVRAATMNEHVRDNLTALRDEAATDRADASGTYPLTGGPAASGVTTGVPDTDAINAALLADKTVTLHPGATYYVTTLLVPKATTLHIPAGTTVTQVSGTAGPIITTSTPGDNAHCHIIVDGIVTAASNTSNAGGIILEGATYSTVTGTGYINNTRSYGVQILGHGAATTGDAMYCQIHGLLVQNLVDGVAFGVTPSTSGSHPDGARITFCKVNSAVGTAFRVDPPSGTNLGTDSVVIAHCNTMEVPTILDLTGQSIFVLGNRFEKTSGTMTVVVNAGPGTFPTRGTDFIKNTYATYGDPAGLVFTDNSGDGCQRIAERGAGGRLTTSIRSTMALTGKLESTGATPTLSNLHAGVESATIDGTDTKGVITVTTNGTGVPGNTAILNVNFTQSYTVVPVVVCSKQDAVGGASEPRGVNISKTSMQLATGTSLAASATFRFGYVVIG